MVVQNGPEHVSDERALPLSEMRIRSANEVRELAAGIPLGGALHHAVGRIAGRRRVVPPVVDAIHIISQIRTEGVAFPVLETSDNSLQYTRVSYAYWADAAQTRPPYCG